MVWHGEDYNGWCPVHGDKYMDNGVCMKCEEGDMDVEQEYEPEEWPEERK